jgi:hypothetical protein
VKRLHLLELEDLAWFPKAARDGSTDFLRFIMNVGKPYHGIFELLRATLRESHTRQIIDLCSGGGGPWPTFISEFEKRGDNISVLMTDKFPSVLANASPYYYSRSVDATHVPRKFPGLRTLFTAFHHFKPIAARALLTDAIKSTQPIAVFECTGRDIRTMALIATFPILALFVMPFIRPFRLNNLIFTYLIPLIPLVLFFDGIVSCFRTYTPQELGTLLHSLPTNHYGWRIGVNRSHPLVAITFLIGIPNSVIPGESQFAN